MTLSGLYKRLLGGVLFILPDDRMPTRRAILRAGVLLRKQNGQLTLEQRKSLVARADKTCRTFIAIGVGMLLVCVQHPMTTLGFCLALGWGIWSSVVWCVERIMG